MNTCRRLAALLVTLGALAPLLRAEQPAKRAEKPRYTLRREHDPHGTGKVYMDREIAQVMGYQGIGWLERPEREQEEEPAKLIKMLDFKPGMAVADIGAGSGYFTFRIAPLVGPRGKVYAVDIQKQMRDRLSYRMKALNISNVQPVRGTITTPNLPAGAIDLILMVDVYHEFSHPYEMTEAMVKALKPGGRLVFVEYRKEDTDPPVPILDVHKMNEAQVLKEMGPHPLRHVKTLKGLPRQHVIIFEKKAAGESEKPPK
jgi:ubiquinone/menaquinone biosynthesis C-methylase UbiE